MGEVFKQETTNAVMTALLLHDVLNPKSPKNPANRKEHGVLNSLELFRTQSVHGGLWRSQYKMDTIGEFSVLVYFTGVLGPYLIACPFAAAAIYRRCYLAISVDCQICESSRDDQRCKHKFCNILFVQALFSGVRAFALASAAKK